MFVSSRVLCQADRKQYGMSSFSRSPLLGATRNEKKQNKQTNPPSGGTGSRSPSVYESIVVSVVCFQVAPSAIQRCPKHTVIIRRRLSSTKTIFLVVGLVDPRHHSVPRFVTDLAGLMHPARAPMTRWAQWHASHAEGGSSRPQTC